MYRELPVKVASACLDPGQTAGGKLRAFTYKGGVFDNPGARRPAPLGGVFGSRLG